MAPYRTVTVAPVFAHANVGTARAQQDCATAQKVVRRVRQALPGTPGRLSPRGRR
jgi:hypothetical protein